MEMRLHRRLFATVAMTYQLNRLESGDSWKGEGTLKNISFGGVYFTCEGPLPLEPGQIRNFWITAGAPCEKLGQASGLTARSLVLRVERPAAGNAACGIALKFLTPLQLSFA